MCARPIKVFASLSTFNAAHISKTPGSPHLHNFNVPVPERGSLGTRGNLGRLHDGDGLTVYEANPGN